MSKIFDNKWHSSDPVGSQVCVARFVICYAAVGTRFYCKVSRQSRKALRWDDLLIVLALISSTIGEAVILWGLSRGGSGIQAPILVKAGQYKGVQDFLISVFIGGMSDYFTSTFIRLSVLSFYRSIFGTDSNFRLASTIIGVTSVIWTTACLFAHIFMCTPVNHLWKPLSPGVCHNFMLFFLITEIIETLMDAAILTLPIRSVLALQLPLKSRVSIIGIFLLGGFVVVTDILRIKFMYQPDTHYVDFQEATLWTSVHVTSAFTCACLPLYKPILMKVIESTNSIRSLLSASRTGSRSGVSRINSREAQNQRDGPFTKYGYRAEQYGSDSSFKLTTSYKAKVSVHTK